MFCDSFHYNIPSYPLRRNIFFRSVSSLLIIHILSESAFVHGWAGHCFWQDALCAMWMYFWV